MNNKSKLKSMNFSDILNIVEASNTSDSIYEEAAVNSPKNTRRRNHRIYINYIYVPIIGFYML